MIPKFRVLHLRASPFVGGPERQILRYAGFDLGDQIETIVGSFVDEREGHEFLAAAEAQGTKTLSLPGGTRSALKKLKRFVRDEHISLICTHGYKADILGVLAGRAHDVPAAAFLRGWTGQDTKVSFYEWLDRRMLPFAQAVVALSQIQRERLARKSSVRGKLHVVTNSIASRDIPQESLVAARSQLRSRFGFASTQRVVISAGRLSPEKGTIHFVEAAKQLAAQDAALSFVVFGTGTELERLKSSAAGASQIVFAGHVTDFQALVAGADLLVNPSFAEEMPNVVLEAIASGVPVVATSVGGVPEIAGPEGCVRLVAPGDSSAIRDAVAQLLADPAQMKSLSEKATRRLKENFSPEKQKQELAELYSKLVPAYSTQTSKAPPLATGDMPFISIAMPVRNEARYIGKVLQAIEEQDYPKDRFEIIVADGNSNDDTCKIVETFARTSKIPTKVVNNPRQLSSAGRNIGIEHSRGDIVAFIDGHCVIENRGLLRAIADIMESTGAACLCRPQPLDDPDNNAFQNVVAHCRGSALGHGLDSSIFGQAEGFIDPTSSGAIYKRSVFDKIGRYDETFDACEDVELNHRVKQSGERSYISPRLTVRYAPRAGLSALMKQMMRYGRGRFRFVRKHPGALSLGQVIPPGFIVWLTITALLSPWSPVARMALLATAIIYAGAVLLSSLLLAFKYGARYLFQAPFVYGAIHFGLGLGFLQQMLFGPSALNASPVKARQAISGDK